MKQKKITNILLTLLLFGASANASIFTNITEGNIVCVTNRSGYILTNPSIANPAFIMTTVRLEIHTNWTAYTFQGQELGYIATNHIASVIYQGTTDEYMLKTVPSDIARWRTKHFTETGLTNINWVPWGYTNAFITNLYNLIQCSGNATNL